MNIDDLTDMLAENLDRGFSVTDSETIITGRDVAYMTGCGEIYDCVANKNNNMDNTEQDNND